MPCTVSRPLKLPRRPILMVSPSAFSLEGSPTRHQSMRFLALAQHFDHAARAVHGRAFLIAGDQERDACRDASGYRPDELLAGGQHGGEAALHVGGAPAVQQAVANDRHEGIAAPFIQRPRRHHVGVAGEAEDRTAAAALAPRNCRPGQSAGSRREIRAPRSRCDHQRLATAVGGTHRRPRDQFLGEFQGLGEVRPSEAQHRRLAPQVHPQAEGAEPGAAISTQAGMARPEEAPGRPWRTPRSPSAP